MHLDEIERRHLLDTIPPLDLWGMASRTHNMQLRAALIQRYGGVSLCRINKTLMGFHYFINFLGEGAGTLYITIEHAALDMLQSTSQLRVIVNERNAEEHIVQLFDAICGVEHRGLCLGPPGGEYYHYTWRCLISHGKFMEVYDWKRGKYVKHLEDNRDAP